jgi:polysaccharide export outer membrane protein
MSLIGEKKIMFKSIMLCLVAALLSGCANSSAENFDSVVVSNQSEPTKVTASAADLEDTTVTSQRPVQLASARRGGALDENGSVPAITNSLQGAALAITAAGRLGDQGYKIGPQDVIEVSVFKVPELSKVVQVSENGTLNLPLVGEISVAGHTARDVENKLATLLGEKYLQKPQVTVFVKEYNSQRVTVEGAVKRPGVFQMQGRLSLLQAVAMAQGLDSVSDETVLIFRDVDGERKAARFDISEIRSGDAEDPHLIAGDVVVAGTSSFKEGFNGLLKVLPITGLFALL